MITANDNQLILLTTNGYSPSNSKEGIWYRSKKNITDYIDFRGDYIKAYSYNGEVSITGDLKLLRRLRIVNDKIQTKLFDENIWRKEEYE